MKIDHSRAQLRREEFNSSKKKIWQIAIWFLFPKTRTKFGYFTFLVISFGSEHHRNVQSFMIELFITIFCSFDLIKYETHDSREKGMLFTLPSPIGASVMRILECRCTF